jgi:hypothetical protein
MKIRDLLEKHIVRDDLIVFLDAFEHEHSHGEFHCLLKALVEAFKLKHVHISEKDLYEFFAHNDWDGSGADIHPNEVVEVLKDKFNIEFTYDFVNGMAEAKTALAKELPLIVSIRWSDSYYLAAKILRDGKRNDSDHWYWAHYRELGATQDMVEKVKNGIIPFPNQDMLDNSEYEPTTHAILCVGYEAGDDCFIVRDFNPGDPDYNGFFKIESRLFFDPQLRSDKRIAVVEAVISIDVEQL